MASTTQAALTPDERAGIVLAVQSAFTKLKNLYQRIAPIFDSYGFTAPSAGVIARDLSEKIEVSIVQHCASFSKGAPHCDLARDGHDWEVKICKDSGLTINQSKRVAGENYIVVNYKANSQVTRIWVLWDARDDLFSERRPNTNARALVVGKAGDHIETLFTSRGVPQKSDVSAVSRPRAAKASLRNRTKQRSA